MPIPVLYLVNRLEAAVVTVTGAASDSPKERLFDRDVTLLYKDSGTTGLREIPRADLGASPPAHDGLILGPGHNLASLGVPTTLETSSNGSTWAQLDSFTPAGTTAVLRTYTDPATRYVRLSATSPSVAPQLTEVFLSKALTLSRYPLVAGSLIGSEANIIDFESRGGYVWSSELGPERWTATYAYSKLTDADKAALLQAFLDARGGSKFVWLLDTDGVLRWVQWLDRVLAFRPVVPGLWDITLKFREAL